MEKIVTMLQQTPCKTLVIFSIIYLKASTTRMFMFVSPLLYLYDLNFDDKYLGSTNKLNVVHPQKYLQITMLHTCNESDTMCSVASWSLLWRGDHKMLLRIVMMVYVLSYWISCKWYIIAQMITDLIYFVTLKLLLNFRLFMSHLIIKKWLWTPSHMPEYILLHFSEHIFFSTKCNHNLNQNNKTSVSNFIQKSSGVK